MCRVIDSLNRQLEMRYGSQRVAFQKLDRDGSGTLSKEELRAGLGAWNVRLMDSQLERLVALMDSNGDDEVSFAEFYAALRQVEASPFRTDDRKARKHEGVTEPRGARTIDWFVANGGTLSVLPHVKDMASPTQVDEYATAMSQRIYSKHKRIKDAFRAFDENKDGRLSKGELVRAARTFNMQIPYEHMLQLAEKCDANGDGTVDYAEFVAGLKRKDALGN